MSDAKRNDFGRFILSVGIGLTVWGFSLAWYLYCKRNGSAYNLSFLIFNAPGVPGGFLGYWIYQAWGGGPKPMILYRVCELVLPSLTICIAWTNLGYQTLSRLGREEAEEKATNYRGLLLAIIPFLIGWCAIPFIIGRLAG